MKPDVIILGGGVAGLSAAMALGRVLRKVLVLDSGQYRNAPAAHAHNLIGFDGTPPAEIRAKALEQVLAYETVTYRQTSVLEAGKTADGRYYVRTAEDRYQAPALILATSFADELPAIDGLPAFWGSSAVVCPYCHGFEFKGRPTAMLVPEMAQALRIKMISRLAGPLTLLTNGHPELLDDDLRRQATEAGYTVYDDRVTQALGTAGQLEALVLADGTRVEAHILYLHTGLKPRLNFWQGAHPQILRKDPAEMLMADQTDYPGLYMAGDLAGLPQSLAAALFSGQIAGSAANHWLLMREGL